MSYYNQGNQQQNSDGGFYGQQQQQSNQYEYQQQGGFQQGYGDPNSWQQQQHPQSQPQPQYQQQQNAFWNPATAASMAAVATSAFTGATTSNDQMMLDVAGQMGKSFLQNSSARMIPGLERSMQALRSYFAVDNKYVLCKMKRVLFPFSCKQWKRQEKDIPPTSDHTIPPVTYQLPVHDECAPDLYLPIMSGITYVLLSALLYGTAGQFNPEVIPHVTTQCLVTQSLEVAAIRLGFYLMQCPVTVLDLFSYTGYKYLGLCINMLVGIVVGHFGLSFGSRGYYATFLWTASAASYFMLKTMANNIPLHTAQNGPKREVMVVVFAASQFATMWFVSQTKFL